MRKVLSLIAGLALIASPSGLTASAEEPVPADIDKQAYANLVKYNLCDYNLDGVIEESELERETSITLELDGVKDISWLERMKSCRYVEFKGGTLTDFSVLKLMPKLREVTFDSVPLTDISFVKDMELVECSLKNMDQITKEQRMEVAELRDVEIEAGFKNIIGVYPIGIFGDSKIELRYDDTDIVEELSNSYDRYRIQRDLYGIKEGSTTCRAYIDGEEKFTAKITVLPMERIAPPLNDKTTRPQVYQSFYYGSRYVVLDNGVLYGIRGDKYYKVMENVKYCSTTYKKNADGDYVYIDLVMLNDGTLILNDKVVEGVKFDYILDGCAVTADGTLYSIYPDGKEPVIVKAGENCKSLITADRFYLSESGEVVWYNVDYDSKGNIILKTRDTGIMDPQYVRDGYFLEENGTLWNVRGYSYFSKNKIADDVISIGYYNSSIGYRSYVYTTSDGKSYCASDKKEVEIYEDTPGVIKRSYLQDGCFYLHEYDSKYGDNSDLLIDWFITEDSTLTIDLAGRHFAISDVERVIGAEFVKYQDKGYAWFIRKDGSVWRYCFEDKEAVQMTPLESMPEVLRYDVNLDGEFNVADVVTFQRWLLGVPDVKLADWNAADICGDYELNVFDLCMMKKALIEKLN